MPVFAPLQIISIVIAALLYVSLPISTSWYGLVFSLGYSHYLLGLFYSHRPLRQIAHQPHSVLPVRKRKAARQ